MITAVLIAASVLAPQGTATIQGGPVCLPVTAQPGSTYDLHVSASAGALSVVPAHGTLERRLHQVPPSWVSFGSSGSVRLSVPQDAAPGAYWSDITVTSASGGSGQARLGTAATAAFVFTVGPSATPSPPCDALTLGYSTGKLPAWPDPRFATSSVKQMLGRDRPARPRPEDTCPTATAGPAASAAPSYCPGSGPAPAYSPAAQRGPGRRAAVRAAPADPGRLARLADPHHHRPGRADGPAEVDGEVIAGDPYRLPRNTYLPRGKGENAGRSSPWPSSRPSLPPRGEGRRLRPHGYRARHDPPPVRRRRRPRPGRTGARQLHGPAPGGPARGVLP